MTQKLFGIRIKSVLLIGVLLLLIFGAITVYQVGNNTKTLRNSLFEESHAFASLATRPIGNVFNIYRDSGTLKIDQQVDEFMDLNDQITNVTIVDVSGRQMYAKDASIAASANQEEASTFEPIYKYDDSGALNTIIYPYFEASGAHRYSIIYSVSDEEIEMAVQREAISLIYFGLLSLVVTMMLVYLLINSFIIKPVRKVSEQAMVISAGNLDQQIEIHGRDEIASLGQSVNKMAESLKRSIAELKEIDKVKTEFMMITSHNLRTPLTIIDGYLDNMSLVMNDREKLLDGLKRIGSGVKRLELFAEDILAISRFELGDTNELLRDKIIFGDLMKQILETFQFSIDQKQQILTTDLQGSDAVLNISVPYVRSAISNILDNASKFTENGGKIRVSSYNDKKNVYIKIADAGIGISADELPKLFTKFHRGTSTLTYNYEGTGIGLYASKMMIEKHGGDINVESELGKGSTFTIRLPLEAL